LKYTTKKHRDARSGIPVRYSLIRRMLLHQDHLFGGLVVGGAHADHIDAAGDGIAARVTSVEHHFVMAGGLNFPYEAADQLAFEVVDLDFHGTCFLDAVADGGLGIEGIGEVAVERGGGNGDLRIVVVRALHQDEVHRGGQVLAHGHVFHGLAHKSCGRSRDAVGSHRHYQSVGTGTVGGGCEARHGDGGPYDGSGVFAAHHTGNHASDGILVEDIGERSHRADAVGVYGFHGPAVVTVGKSGPAWVIGVETGHHFRSDQGPGGFVAFLSGWQTPDLVTGEHSLSPGCVADLVLVGQSGLASQSTLFLDPGSGAHRHGAVPA